MDDVPASYEVDPRIERSRHHVLTATVDLLLSVKERVEPYFDVKYCVKRSMAILNSKSEELEMLDWAAHLARLAEIVGAAGGDLGVDLEKIDPDFPALETARREFPAEEASFLERCDLPHDLHPLDVERFEGSQFENPLPAMRGSQSDRAGKAMQRTRPTTCRIP